jgi:hypothetical protein
MKKVLILLAAFAAITATSCQKDVVAPLSNSAETFDVSDVSDDTEDFSASEGTSFVELRSLPSVAAIRSGAKVTDRTSGDEGCTNFKHTGYYPNGVNFQAPVTESLDDKIISATGVGVSAFTHGSGSVSFRIDEPSIFTYGNVTVTFKTTKGASIKKNVKVINKREGLLPGTWLYNMRFLGGVSADKLAAPVTPVTATTGFVVAGNLIVIGGKKSVVRRLLKGKIMGASGNLHADNQLEYGTYGVNCDAGAKITIWKGQGFFPSTVTGVVR